MTTRVPLRCRRSGANWVAVCALTVAALASPAQATSTIIIEDPIGPIFPGDTFSFLIRISGATALAGYTVDLRVTPQPGAVGTLTGQHLMSNFYSSQNLIAQGGMGLHPTFSTIQSLQPANPGLLITAVDSTFLPHAVPGPGKDVLAQVFFTASGNAFGDFVVSLGDDTILAIDGVQEEDYPPAQITIRIPEPGYLGILSGMAALCLRRRRKTA